MSEAWKRVDLGGEGLQQANLRLAAALRRTRIAYLLWLAFPLGAHRVYLREPRGAWAYRLASVLAVVLFLLDWRASALLGGILVAAALYDLLYWIGRRLTEVNKALRMQAYLRPVAGAPPGYRGRFAEDEDAPRPPSFAEQERLLAEIERRKRSEN